MITAASQHAQLRSGTFRSAPQGSTCTRNHTLTAAAAGYDVWAKTIEALADIGYDNTNLIAMPYDWRLSLPNMELRDGYFTKLRSEVRPDLLPSLPHSPTSVRSQVGVSGALPAQTELAMQAELAHTQTVMRGNSLLLSVVSAVSAAI